MSTEKLNEIYDEYSKSFQKTLPSFHNLLWQIIINGVHSEKICAFTVNLDKNGHQIVIAEMEERGYIPTGVYFLATLTYDECGDICEELNDKVFCLSPRHSSAIVTTSLL